MIKNKMTIDELVKEVLISKEQQPYDTPKNWSWVKLGEVVSSLKGKKPKELLNSEEEGTIPYVTINYMTNGDNSETQYLNKSHSKVECDPNDILMVWDAARSGLVGRGVSGEVGSTLVKLNCRNFIPNYLYYFLVSKYEYINKNHRGTGIPHVNPEVLWNIPFPIAPLNEQKRIADKVESLLTNIKEAEKKIEDLPDLFDQLRKSILELAFFGELTEIWRENAENIEPVSRLIDQINRDRARKITDEKNIAKIEGRRPRKIMEAKFTD